MSDPNLWFDLEDDVDDVDEKEEKRSIKYWLGDDEDEPPYGEGEDDGYRDKKANSGC